MMLGGPQSPHATQYARDNGSSSDQALLSLSFNLPLQFVIARSMQICKFW